MTGKRMTVTLTAAQLEADARAAAQGVIMDIPRYSKVRLLVACHGSQPGRIGMVKARVAQDGKALYLIKWEGRTWPHCAARDQIEPAE